MCPFDSAQGRFTRSVTVAALIGDLSGISEKRAYFAVFRGILLLFFTVWENE
jgi:hypothetical protein